MLPASYLVPRAQKLEIYTCLRVLCVHHVMHDVWSGDEMLTWKDPHAFLS